MLSVYTVFLVLETIDIDVLLTLCYQTYIKEEQKENKTDTSTVLDKTLSHCIRANVEQQERAP